MSDFADLRTWVFDGLSFARIVSGDGWQRWFKFKTIYQKDPVLDNTTPYIDTGTQVREPLSLRACFDSMEDRDAMINKIGKKASLTNGKGRTVTAVLVEAMAFDMGTTLLWVAELVFEA